MSLSRYARSVLLALGALVITCASMPQRAAAHVPELESPASSSKTIGGPEVSRALYGYLAPNEEGDLYRFRVETTVTRPVSVLVPAYDEHRDFRPSLTLFGDGRSISIEGDPGTRKAEWEPFSLTSFWMGPEQEITFEPDVDYELVVRAGGSETSGRYVIVFGGPEAFGAAETMETLGELPVIWFGGYGGAPLRFNALGLVVLALVAAVLAGLVLLGARLIRRRLGRSRAG